MNLIEIAVNGTQWHPFFLITKKDYILGHSLSKKKSASGPINDILDGGRLHNEMYSGV